MAAATSSCHVNHNGSVENGVHSVSVPNDLHKPFLELYVKASGIDNRRIGACLFCQEFWMELYALYELNLVRVEVKTVNVNSEPFKKNFLGAQPPILVEPERQMTYGDNRELEGRIFHIAKEFHVPLFEKDVAVEKKIESLYRNFKVFLKCKTDYDRSQPQANGVNGNGAMTNGGGGANGHVIGYGAVQHVGNLPAAVQPPFNKVVEQLSNINKLLEERCSRYLLGSSMTEYDCELMPRLHHIRIAGELLCGVEIPHHLVYLWNYILTAYRTAAFIESCPADQDIVYHYKEQLNLPFRQRESLQVPTKTHTIPEDVLVQIKKLGLDL